jgi:putative phosphoribosyl transferase
MEFKDRVEAGKKLAQALKEYKGRDDVVLFALPRGGAVLGAEVSKVLGIPFDLIVTRKIGSPSNEEYAIGALAETGEAFWNERERASHPQEVIDKIIKKETEEAKRRIDLYRKGRELSDLKGKTAIIIDDGMATGATMRAAIFAAQHQNAKKIVIAVPHGAKDSLDAIRKLGFDVVSLSEPDPYYAVGQYYDVFGQTEDKEVLELMKKYGPKA